VVETICGTGRCAMAVAGPLEEVLWQVHVAGGNALATEESSSKSFMLPKPKP